MRYLVLKQDTLWSFRDDKRSLSIQTFSGTAIKIYMPVSFKPTPSEHKCVSKQLAEIHLFKILENSRG